MHSIQRIEDSIAETLVNVLKRAVELKGKDQLALAKEYKEWIQGPPFDEEILIIDEFTFNDCNF